MSEAIIVIGAVVIAWSVREILWTRRQMRKLKALIADIERWERGER